MFTRGGDVMNCNLGHWRWVRPSQMWLLYELLGLTLSRLGTYLDAHYHFIFSYISNKNICPCGDKLPLRTAHPSPRPAPRICTSASSSVNRPLSRPLSFDPHGYTVDIKEAVMTKHGPLSVTLGLDPSSCTKNSPRVYCVSYLPAVTG